MTERALDIQKGPRPELPNAFATGEQAGKHQGPARPPTGQHAPVFPPTNGDPTPERSLPRWTSIPRKSCHWVAKRAAKVTQKLAV